jgi:hypothetical protein
VFQEVQQLENSYTAIPNFIFNVTYKIFGGALVFRILFKLLKPKKAISNVIALSGKMLLTQSTSNVISDPLNLKFRVSLCFR